MYRAPHPSRSSGPPAAVGCFHCGAPVPADARWSARVDDVRHRFCCAGCLAVAQTIRGKSPMACKVSLKLLQESPYQLHFVDEMRMEYGIMVRLIHHPDFKEGVTGHPELSLDGNHPNSAGEAIVVERMLPSVLELIDRVEKP